MKECGWECEEKYIPTVFTTVPIPKSWMEILNEENEQRDKSEGGPIKL